MIRTKLYELLTKGITHDMIFGVLAREFLKKPTLGGARNQNLSSLMS
jgi:hypothetical protein